MNFEAFPTQPIQPEMEKKEIEGLEKEHQPGVQAELDPSITKRAEEILNAFEDGGIPTFISRRLKEVLTAYNFTGDEMSRMLPADLLEELKKRHEKLFDTSENSASEPEESTPVTTDAIMGDAALEQQIIIPPDNSQTQSEQIPSSVRKGAPEVLSKVAAGATSQSATTEEPQTPEPGRPTVSDSGSQERNHEGNKESSSEKTDFEQRIETIHSLADFMNKQTEENRVKCKDMISHHKKVTSLFTKLVENLDENSLPDWKRNTKMDVERRANSCLAMYEDVENKIVRNQIVVLFNLNSLEILLRMDPATIHPDKMQEIIKMTSPERLYEIKKSIEHYTDEINTVTRQCDQELDKLSDNIKVTGRAIEHNQWEQVKVYNRKQREYLKTLELTHAMERYNLILLHDPVVRGDEEARHFTLGNDAPENLTKTVETIL